MRDPDEGRKMQNRISPTVGAVIAEESLAEMAAGKGTKDDFAKPRFDLIPPIPLRELAELYTYGSKKYTDHNWMNGMAWSRPIAALERHLNRLKLGEDIDPETGLPHAIAIAWNAFALAQYRHTHRHYDNRYDWLSERV